MKRVIGSFDTWRLDEKAPPPETHSHKWLRRPKVTVRSVGAVATLLGAIAGLITALTPWFGNDSGKQASAVPGPPPTTATQPRRSLDHLVYSSSLEGRGPFETISANGCVLRFTDLGYRIETQDRFKFCDSLIKPTADIVSLDSARLEVTVHWTRVPKKTFQHYGAGDVGLRCRGNGSGNNANGYFGTLTSSGHWEFNRYVDGKQHRIDAGNDPALASQQGGIRRLRLDCVELSAGAVQLTFYVDNDIVGTYTDGRALPLGLVGLSSASYTTSPFAATFRELRVYGPSS